MGRARQVSLKNWRLNGYRKCLSELGATNRTQACMIAVRDRMIHLEKQREAKATGNSPPLAVVIPLPPRIGPVFLPVAAV